MMRSFLLSLPLLLVLQEDVHAAFTTMTPPAALTKTSTTLNSVSLKDASTDERMTVVKTSSLPGNFNFDPLHLAHSKEQLIVYRQAEMKHGRLAMCAALAIMASDFQVVDALGFSDYFEGRAFPELMGALVGLPMAVELYADKIEDDHADHYLHDHEKDILKLKRQQKKHGEITSEDNIQLDDPFYFPGNLELDPFHLFPAEKKAERRVQFAEIMAGRVCMLAVAMRLSEELLWQLGIEDTSTISLATALTHTLQNALESVAI